MKTTLKFIVIILCFCLLGKTGMTQTPKDEKKELIAKNVQTNAPFLGIWELYKVTTNSQPLQDYPPGYIKIYNADGTFSIIRVQNGGSIIKGSGYYIIDNDHTCREAENAEELATKGFKINYEFSQGKKVLSVSFSYQTGVVYTEVYRKLERKI